MSVRALLPLLSLWACEITVHTDKFDSGDTGITPDAAPACEIVSPVEGEILPANALVTLVAAVSDGESDPGELSVTWESNEIGEIGTSVADESGEAALTTDLFGVGMHLVTLTVVDPAGNPCVDQVTVEVAAAPVVAISAPADGSVVPEGPLLLVGTVSDADESADLLDVSWTDSVAGALDATPADASGAVAYLAEGLALGVHTVTLTATDGTGLVGAATVTFTVNGVPSDPAVSLTPADPDTNDDLVVAIDLPSVDPDGTAVTYVYEWLRDGVVDAASVSDVLPASATERGETWTVNVAATDGFATSGIATASVVIANSAPVITLEVTPPDAEIVTDTVIHAEASAVDGDGDTFTLEYRWLLNGIQLAESGPDLDGEIWFDKDDVVELTVTADDGVTTSEATWSVTVANSAPLAPLVAIAPDPPSDADDLVCEIVAPAVDPDGDLVSYDFAWDVNGVPVPDASTTTTFLPNDTIPAFRSGPGEVWTCTVTPTDGLANGVIRQDTVVIP